MSIAPGNYITHTQQAGLTNQGVTPYASHHQVSKNEQDDFEQSLYGPNWDKKTEDAFNKELTNLGFRQANATSRHYGEEYKKTMDDLNDSGKSKSRHRQG